MPNIQSGQKLGEWNSTLGKADITVKRRLSGDYASQREAHTALAKSGEQGAIVRESDGRFSAYAIDDGSYTDDLNVGETFKITHNPAPNIGAAGTRAGQAQVVVDFIGDDGGSLTSGQIVAPPKGKDNGQTVYFMRGLNSEGVRGKFENVAMNAPNKALQTDEILRLQHLGYSVVIDNTATHSDLRNAFYDPTTAGVVYLGHGGGGEIYTHDKVFFGPQHLNANQVSPNLKMVYWQSCQAGLKQQEWQQKFGPQTTIYSWDRNATNGEVMLVNGSSAPLNPFSWKGETLHQTITRHLKNPGTTLSPPPSPTQEPPANLNEPVTQAELQWAMEFENAVSKRGYNTPTVQELDKYNEIYLRYHHQQTKATAKP